MISHKTSNSVDDEFKSLWQATSTQLEIDSFEDNLDCDILIIGAGFTGLSAALHLSELEQDVVVVDAVEPGYGASGRNGGQVIPGLKLYPEEVRKQLGDEKGNAVINATNGSADLVFDLIKKYQIDCKANRNGFIQPAFSNTSCGVIRSRVELLSKLGAPVELLDKETTAEYLGTSSYFIALLDKRGGSLQPLSYARGLAKAAIRQGVKIYSNALVNKIKPLQDRWQASTQKASINANRILICTNGYSDLNNNPGLWPGLNRSIIPLHSFQVATQPLSNKLRQSILPHGHVASDTKRLLNYFRLDHEGRLILGGSGNIYEGKSIRDFSHIVKRIQSLFPQITEPQFEFYWSGKIALTMSGLPHIHEMAPGVYSGLGYNGRGVGMATLMGQWLAELVTDGDQIPGMLPLTTIKPIKLQSFRKPVITAAYFWKSLQDRVEGRQKPI